MKLLTVNGRTIDQLQEVEHKRPKKCLSSYMIFVKDRRSKISKANPDMPVLQIMKEVGKEWQSLIPENRKKYQLLADQDKIRYKHQLKLFEKEVEKLQVQKPTKGKTKTQNKRKADNKIDLTSPKVERSDYKRKFLETESTDFSRTANDSSHNKEELKNDIIKPLQPIPQRKDLIEPRPREMGTPNPVSLSIIPTKDTGIFNGKGHANMSAAVSYTHLTLPTICSV